MGSLWAVTRRQGLSPDWAFLASVAAGAALGLALLIVLSWREPRPGEDSTGLAEPVWFANSPARFSHPGLLVDMRDEALGRLIAAPADLEAMDALVRMQRALAANNPNALRVEAAVYARAVRAGVQTSEHYTPQAMRLLVLANLLGATQIETERGVRPRVEQTRYVVAQPGPPALQAAIRAALPVPLQPQGGAHPRRGYFLVLSVPMRVAEAQVEVSRLVIAGLVPLLRRTSEGRVQVQLGAFSTQTNAEAIAVRARQRGLAVSVVRGPAGAAFESVQPVTPAALSSEPMPRAPNFSQLMERGIRLYGAGWYGPALASFRQAARTRPDSARAHLWWGRAAFKVFRFREARHALLRTLDLSADTEAGRQARLLLQAMKSADAVTTTPGTE